MTLLTVEGLSLSIDGTPILRDLSFGIEAGEILGVIGESGSGKSLTALSIMQLLPSGSQSRGRVLFAGQDLAAAAEPDLCAVRGRDIGMVFQEPMTALNPLQTIGQQVAETIRIHDGASRSRRWSAPRPYWSSASCPPRRCRCRAIRTSSLEGSASGW